MKQTVGMIGVGVMGTAFTRNLVKAGFNVVGYDPLPEAMERLRVEGGTAMASPRAVAEAAPVAFLSLPSTDALHAAVGTQEGLAAAEAKTILIETSTLPLADKETARDRLAATGKTLLDCPLSGTGAQALVKDLVVFGSGDLAAYDIALPAIQAMSRQQFYLGEFGRGSVMKYIANLLVTIHTVSTAEAMVFGMKAGFDPGVIYDTLKESAGTSRMFQVRGGTMRDEAYDKVASTIKTHCKDLSIIEDFASQMHCPTPLFAVASQVYQMSAAQGRELQDTSSVCAAMELAAGFVRPGKA